MRARSPKIYCSFKTTLAWIISCFYKRVPLYMLCSTQTSISFGNYVLIDQVWVVWHTKVEGDWKKKNEKMKKGWHIVASLSIVQESWTARKSVCILCVCTPPPPHLHKLWVWKGQGSSVSSTAQYRCTVQMYSTDVGLISQCNKGYCPSHLSVQALLWCSRSRCVQSHASTFVFRLKSQALADMLVFGHAKRMHTPVGMVSSALVAAGASPR